MGHGKGTGAYDCATDAVGLAEGDVDHVFRVEGGVSEHFQSTTSEVADHLGGYGGEVIVP
jgi:hypothetical protein